VSETATTAKWRNPAFLQRHAGKLVLIAGALLVFLGLKDVHFVRLARDDDSTPGFAGGSRVFVRTIEQDDGELQRGALYLVDVTGKAHTLEMLRMARLVGLPGDLVAETASLAPEIAALLPARVPDGHCLVLTDNRDCRHLDSRALGPLPLERLKLRVVANASFLQ
jgi:hypothetical protein